MALTSQAAWHSQVGDRIGGLAAADEAVTHYRTLAEANPAAFTADLAKALTNQAVSRSHLGDQTGALAAIDEAVILYRALAETNPDAFSTRPREGVE